MRSEGLMEWLTSKVRPVTFYLYILLLRVKVLVPVSYNTAGCLGPFFVVWPVVELGLWFYILLNILILVNLKSSIAHSSPQSLLVLVLILCLIMSPDYAKCWYIIEKIKSQWTHDRAKPSIVIQCLSFHYLYHEMRGQMFLFLHTNK